MRRRARRLPPVLLTVGSILSGAALVRAADPEIDRLLQSPVGKDWITNGGNLTNQRYSTLKQIDTTNVKQLKGAWMTRLRGFRVRRKVLGGCDAARHGRDHVRGHRQ